ncbi:hypothetical protein BH10PLA2_BH10PLA2_29450 [soil metagenome]
MGCSSLLGSLNCFADGLDWQMPFTAECYFCHLKIQNVPDSHRGVSKQCPRCKNQLTLAEISRTRAMPVVHQGESSATPDLTFSSPQKPLETRPERRPASADSTTLVIASALEIVVPDSPEPTLISLPLPPRMGRTRPRTGLVALCFASLAFMTMTVPGAAWIAAMLAILALALGGACLMTSLPRSRRDLAAVPATVVGFGILASLTYSHHAELLQSVRTARPVEATPAQAVVHLRTEGVNRRIETKEQTWIDAESDAAQVGNIRVRVVSAALESVGPVNAVPRRIRPEKRLVIRLRISNTGASKLEHYKGWNEFTRGSGEDRLRLRDESGKTIRPQYETSIGSSKVIKDADIPPEKWIDDFLIFEVPATRSKELRLELPGAAIGSKDTLSFRIPYSISQRPGDQPSGTPRIK